MGLSAAPVCEGLSARVSRRITGANKLNPLQFNPSLVRGAVEASVLHHLQREQRRCHDHFRHFQISAASRRLVHLSDEGDDSLRAVFVHVGQIDLVTEQHQPLAQLDGGEDHAVRSPAVLAVVVESLQQQFGGGGTGEVQTNNLAGSSKSGY